MKASVLVGCVDFPCTDVRHEGYVVPGVEVDPEAVRIVLISEAAPADPADWYDAPGNPLFAETTVLAFKAHRKARLVSCFGLATKASLPVPDIRADCAALCPHDRIAP